MYAAVVISSSVYNVYVHMKHTYVHNYRVQKIIREQPKHYLLNFDP